MQGNVIDYHREINLFMRYFCANDEARLSIIQYYDVFPHAYDVYAPGQKVYGWANMGKLIGDEGIMLVVRNKRNGLPLYPVFKPAMAMDLLKRWQLPVPLKWSVFKDDQPKLKSGSVIHPVNQELRNLLTYTRLFVSMQYRMQIPRSFGFEESYELLHRFPEQGVDGAIIELINRVIREHLVHEGVFVNCRHLQEFITYLHNKYTMLNFVDRDFPLLRKLLAKENPHMRCFF